MNFWEIISSYMFLSEAETAGSWSIFIDSDYLFTERSDEYNKILFRWCHLQNDLITLHEFVVAQDHERCWCCGVMRGLPAVMCIYHVLLVCTCIYSLKSPCFHTYIWFNSLSCPISGSFITHVCLVPCIVTSNPTPVFLSSSPPSASPPLLSGL